MSLSSPKVDNVYTEKGVLHFTLSGVDVCFANALRRVILGELEIIAIDRQNIIVENCNRPDNTNDQIVQQQLCGVPVHLNGRDFEVANYEGFIDVKNTTDHVIYVTPRDIQVRNRGTGNLLSEAETRELFPAGEFGDIQLVKLDPPRSAEIPGKEMKLRFSFSKVLAKNEHVAAEQISYRYSVDEAKINSQVLKLKQQWKDEGVNEAEPNMQRREANWRALDAFQEKNGCVVPNSFDFCLQSKEHFTNIALIQMGCQTLIQRLKSAAELLQAETQRYIEPAADSTEPYAFFITLKGETHTLGNLLNYMFLTKYFRILSRDSLGDGADADVGAGAGEALALSYSAFTMDHPSKQDGKIKVIYNQAVDYAIIVTHVTECCRDAIHLLQEIQTECVQKIGGHKRKQKNVLEDENPDNQI